ncbi:uncharacterized protein LOC141515482 [Macrotis lagotis]|uniref:uncharacterized protein LOC141515482 n=1 Tax=Macrotis lagotis TaxID=92651 RepID=UPI003D685F5D
MKEPGPGRSRCQKGKRDKGTTGSSPPGEPSDAPGSRAEPRVASPHPHVPSTGHAGPKLCPTQHRAGTPGHRQKGAPCPPFPFSGPFSLSSPLCSPLSFPTLDHPTPSPTDPQSFTPLPMGLRGHLSTHPGQGALLSAKQQCGRGKVAPEQKAASSRRGRKNKPHGCRQTWGCWARRPAWAGAAPLVAEREKGDSPGREGAGSGLPSALPSEGPGQGGWLGPWLSTPKGEKRRSLALSSSLSPSVPHPSFLLSLGVSLFLSLTHTHTALGHSRVPSIPVSEEPDPLAHISSSNIPGPTLAVAPGFRLPQDGFPRLK